MAAFTPAQVIEYGKLSTTYASIDQIKSKLFSPRISPNMPDLIDMETQILEWGYNQSTVYPNIIGVANYVYDLCGIYALKARQALNPGGTPVIPVTPGGDSDCNGVEYITSPDFEADGVTVFNSNWNNKVIKIFWNNIPKFIKEGVDWVYVIGGGFRIIIPGFDASPGGSDADVELYVFVGCFSPGAIINPYLTPINTTITVTGVDAYDLVWTAGLLGAYGKGSFQVYQDDGGGVFQPVGILPIPDDFDNPTVYYFTGLGSFNTRIVIS